MNNIINFNISITINVNLYHFNLFISLQKYIENLSKNYKIVITTTQYVSLIFFSLPSYELV